MLFQKAFKGSMFDWWVEKVEFLVPIIGQDLWAVKLLFLISSLHYNKVHFEELSGYTTEKLYK